MEIEEISDLLFTRWGNRCPLDGGFLEVEAGWDCPVLKCGGMHYMSLEHLPSAMEGKPITWGQQHLKDLLGPSYIPHPNPLYQFFAPVPFTPLADFTFEYGNSEYWMNRGFSQEDQHRFDMGVVDGFPGMLYRDSNGIPIGWVKRNPIYPENLSSRSVGSKYVYHKNSKRMVWGKPEAMRLMLANNYDWVVVTEGSTDAARFMQAGIPSVALSQPSPTRSIVVDLYMLTKNLILCPDNDLVGRALMTNGFSRPFFPVFFNADLWLIKRKDPAVYTPEELKEEFEANFPGILR